MVFQSYNFKRAFFNSNNENFMEKKHIIKNILDEGDKKAVFVHEMFDNIASDYDRMNEIISLGGNIKLKKRIIKTVPIKKGMKILDLCTGTGDLAILISERLNKEVCITGVDFSQKMLEIARNKAKNYENIDFIQADVLELPFEENSFEACFIGYGLRNLKDLRKGLLEIKRLLKPGGYFVNLDLGKAGGLSGQLIKLYMNKIVPLFGKYIHGDSLPYQYLPCSNEKFPSQTELVKLLKELGFNNIMNTDFMFGSIASQRAQK